MSDQTYPHGKYRARVLSQGYEEASTGTEQFVMQLRILSRYDDQGGL
jgi:hypothetical protein